MTDWLVAGSVWWDGRLRTGPAALRLAAGDAAGAPVPVADVPAGARRRELPGTLLPGLRDAHVHSALVDLATVRAGGIASVWDLGGVPADLAMLRVPGDRLPRMRIAGRFLTAPGGYPSDRAWAPPGSWREIPSPAAAADAVAEGVRLGADLVKVTAHAGGPMLSAATLAAVVSAAHEAGLPVVMHAEGPGTVEAAVAHGVDLLAHTPWTARLDDALLRASAAGGMTWISTLDIHGWDRPTDAQDTAIDNLRRFRGHGGAVVYGTDLGNGPLIAGVNPREVRALQRAGLTPDEVLTAMTAAPPPASSGPASSGPASSGPAGFGTAGFGPPCWIPGGLDLDPRRFADVLATARVVGPELRPRT